MSQPELFGRYQLLKLLARGGMGEVWFARQGGLDGFEKYVVVKRILPHLAADDDFIDMFRDEANIAAKLNHSNIATVFDSGREGDYYFLCMEYVHGEDVRRVWKQAALAGTPLPAELACRIISDACAGLDFAHKKVDDKTGEPLQIVHRDISPHNLIVTFDGAVKVIDFGIARARGRIAHTATGALKGRFEYMSPEHASGQDVDGRSDVFALGVVLWESLSGRRLFKRENETATILAVARCEVPPPSEFDPSIPPELDAVVLKALKHDREDRYEDAAAFRLAIEDWLVHARMKASNAHLGTFMRSIYTERLSRESALGHPVIEEITHSHTQRKAPAAGALDAPIVAAEEPVAASSKTGAPKSSLPVIIALVAVLILGLGAFFLTRKPASPEPVPAAPQVLAPAPAEPAPQAPVEREVTLHFATEPAGATVLLGGVTIGQTPMSWTTPRSNTALSLEFRLEGHTSHSQSVVPFENSNVLATLQKKAAPRPSPRPATPRPSPEPAMDIKLDR